MKIFKNTIRSNTLGRSVSSGAHGTELSNQNITELIIFELMAQINFNAFI